MALKQQPTISCAAHPKKQQSVPNLEENDYVGSIQLWESPASLIQLKPLIAFPFLPLGQKRGKQRGQEGTYPCP